MKKPIMLAFAAMLSVSAVTVSAADTTKTASTTAKAAVKGEKPSSSPGWLIVEEDFWTPLRFEPLLSLDSARSRYRRSEEKAAANEIDKAISWMKLAENHAMPITKEHLTTAATELAIVAKDLRSGSVSDAADLDDALAKAARALGEWHFYKAKESWGKDETQNAGIDLQQAAQYLQHAANSAHYQFGPDTISITELYSPGIGTTTYDHNTLGKHLDGVEKAIKELSDILEK